MPDKNDEAPALSSSQLFDELSQQLERVAGMSAETVTQVTRIARLIAAGQSLDARSKQQFDDTMVRLERAMRDFAESKTQTFDRMAPLDIARAFDKPRIDGARKLLRDAAENGTALEKKRPDSITFKVSIPVGERGRKKKTAKDVVVLVAKALALAVAGYIIRHLQGH